MNNRKPLVLAGLAAGTMLLAGSASADFEGLDLCRFVGEGWMDNGYGAAGLTTYRLYAEFTGDDPDEGVLAVFGQAPDEIIIESSDGLFHNDEVLGGLTAPVDITSAGIWQNQWDTYVTIGTTTRSGDQTALSPGFATVTNNLGSNWSGDGDGWFVDAVAEQSKHIDGRVLLAQFVVAAGETVSGTVNLFMRGEETLSGLHFGGPACVMDGACCLPDETCLIETGDDCALLGGTYKGDSATCIGDPCVRDGACCLPDESCVIETENDCGVIGGTYLGDSSTCVGDPCDEGTRSDVIVPVEQERCVRSWYSGGLYGGCEPFCDSWSGSCADCAVDLDEVFSHAVGAWTCYGERATASQISSFHGDSVVVFGRAGGTFWSGMGCTGMVSTSSDFSASLEITREATVMLQADIGGDYQGVSSLMRLVDESSGMILAQVTSSGSSREQLDETICLPIGRYLLVAEAHGTPDDDQTGAADMTVSLGVCRADLDCSEMVDFGDLLRVLMAWGACAECPEDIDESGVVDLADLLLVLTAWGPCTWEPDWPGACHLEDGSCGDGLSEDECAALGGQFAPRGVCGSRTCDAGAGCLGDSPLIIEPYIGEGWFEHGFRSMTAYRIYAEFDEIGDDGVLAVFGDSARPLRVTSQDGKFHNAPDFIDSLTSPLDLRSVGIWDNQWDTYVTINGTAGQSDATGLSSGFAEETDFLRRSFVSENAGWFVTPIDEQSRSQDGRVFLGQFVVRDALARGGMLNLLTRENETWGIDFGCEP